MSERSNERHFSLTAYGSMPLTSSSRALYRVWYNVLYCTVKCVAVAVSYSGSSCFFIFVLYEVLLIGMFVTVLIALIALIVY